MTGNRNAGEDVAERVLHLDEHHGNGTHDLVREQAEDHRSQIEHVLMTSDSLISSLESHEAQPRISL